MKCDARGRWSRVTRSWHRRAVILPVVLFILLLVGLLSAMFAFRVNADLAAMRAVEMRFNTRLAAEAGIERAKVLLRDPLQRADMSLWYDNPDDLHRIVVWANGAGPDTLGAYSEDFDEGDMVYRFSLVADNPLDDEDFVRFGLTDESSKLNLNKATNTQLSKLVNHVLGEDPEINADEVVAAILDWRDADQNPIGLEGDTEGDYYQTLPIPYNVKNGNFGTVEELLLVKGVTPEILYGEDFDRNGLLTPNEDDGDETFPEDDQDGVLNQGLFPYLTTTSYETNVSNDNRRRIYLRDDQNIVREQLDEVFPEEPEVVDYIVTVIGGAGTGQPGDEDEGDDDQGEGGGGSGDGGQGDDARGGRENDGGGGSSTRRGRNTGDAGGQPDKSRSRQQRRPDPDEEEDEENDDGSAEEGDPQSDDQQADDEDEDRDPESDDEEGGGDQGEEGEESAEQNRTPASMQSPVSLLLVAEEGTSRIGLEHLSRLLDRTTFIPPETERIEGLININTAPPPVLACIDGLTEEQIQQIVRTRDLLTADEKATFAWLAVEEVLDLETLEKIAPQITARGQQYRIESLGYSDHAGMVTRLLAVVDMLGPIAQTVYQKDISYLGGAYPIREEDLERVRGR